MLRGKKLWCIIVITSFTLICRYHLHLPSVLLEVSSIDQRIVLHILKYILYLYSNNREQLTPSSIPETANPIRYRHCLSGSHRCVRSGLDDGAPARAQLSHVAIDLSLHQLVYLHTTLRTNEKEKPCLLRAFASQSKVAKDEMQSRPALSRRVAFLVPPK